MDADLTATWAGRCFSHRHIPKLFARDAQAVPYLHRPCPAATDSVSGNDRAKQPHRYQNTLTPLKLSPDGHLKAARTVSWLPSPSL